MKSLYLPDQLDRLAKRQDNEKIAFLMSGLTVALVALIAVREFKGLLHDDRRDRSR
jgi:hypothetical protein